MTGLPRSAAFVTMTLIVVALTARPATADSINLMQSPIAPAVGIDASTIRWDDAVEVTAPVDDDCVAVNDDTRTPASRLGSVSWRGGQLTWRWDRAADPSLVYLMCADHRSPRELMDSGLAFVAGMSTSRAARAGGDAALIAESNLGDAPIADANPVASQMPTATDLMTGSLTNTAMDQSGPDVSGPDGFDPPAISMAFDQPITLDPIDLAPFPDFGEPITLDPGEMTPMPAPVPEPGTLLLMGTGLAIAWRGARRAR